MYLSPKLQVPGLHSRWLAGMSRLNLAHAEVTWGCSKSMVLGTPRGYIEILRICVQGFTGIMLRNSL